MNNSSNSITEKVFSVANSLLSHNQNELSQFWMSDSSALVCFECQVAFTTTIRKHHCRLCGRIFCGSCCKNRTSDNMVLATYNKKKLCPFCFNLIEKETKKLIIERKIEKMNYFVPPSLFQPKELEDMKLYISSIISDFCNKYYIDSKWVSILTNISYEIGQRINLTYDEINSLNISHFIHIETVVGENPEDTKYIPGLIYQTSLASSKMPDSIENPKILIIKSSINIQRAENNNNFDFLRMQNEEYVSHSVKRILKLNPTLIFFGSSVTLLAIEEFTKANIAVICNTPEKIMTAVSICTGANILNSLEEIIFAQLGTCEHFELKKVETELNSYNFVILKACSVPTFYSILLHSVHIEEQIKLKKMLSFASYVSFYLKNEYYFLNAIFKGTNSVLGIPVEEYSITNNIKIETSPFCDLPKFIFSSMEEILNKTRTMFRESKFMDNYEQQLDSNQSTFLCQNKLKSINHEVPDIVNTIVTCSAEELGDISATFRSTGVMDFISNVLNDSHNFIPNIPSIYSFDPKQSLSCLDENAKKPVIKNIGLQTSKFFNKLLKIDFRQTFEFLYTMYCSSSKLYPYPCILPCIMRIKLNHKSDITMRDFILRATKANLSCPNSICDCDFISHTIFLFHDDYNIKISFQQSKIVVENSDKHFITLTLKCIICQQVHRKTTGLEISLGTFLRLLLYSKCLFRCEKCHKTSDQIACYRLNQFIHGFHKSGLCVVIRVSKAIRNTIMVPKYITPNSSHKEYVDNYKSKISNFEECIMNSINFLLLRVKWLEDKKLKLDNIEELLLVETNISNTLFNCKERLSELQSKILEFSSLNPLSLDLSVFQNLEELILNFKDYLNSNFKLIVMKLREYKDIFKRLNLTLTSEFLFKSFVVKNTPIISHKRSNSGIKTPFGETTSVDIKEISNKSPYGDNLLPSAYKTEANATKKLNIEMPSSNIMKIPKNQSRTNSKRASFTMENTTPEEIFIDLGSAYRRRSSSLSFSHSITLDEGFIKYIPSSNNDNLKANEIINPNHLPKASIENHFPFGKDFHVFTHQSKSYSFVETDPSSIISISLKILECDENDSYIFANPESQNVIKINNHKPINSRGIQCTDYFIDSASVDGLSNDDIDDDKSELRKGINDDNKRDINIEISVDGIKIVCRIYNYYSFKLMRDLMQTDKNIDDLKISLEESEEWKTSGGKSGSIFYKTKDQKYVIKMIGSSESKCFIEFINSYTDYICTTIRENKLTTLCKIFGIYHISIYNGTLIRSQLFYIVMENVFYQSSCDLLYDIKGCIRKNIPSNSHSNIFQDSDIIDRLCKSPIYVTHASMALIHRALRRDTTFLENNNVIDYSLIVGIDNKKNQISISTIDYLTKFTWEKRLESAVKSGILIATSSGRTPTIIPPNEYRTRFMEAVKLYFYPVPSLWSYYEILLSGSKNNIYFINSPEGDNSPIEEIFKPFYIQDIFKKDKLPSIRRK